MTIAEAIARPMLASMFIAGGLDSVRHGGTKGSAAATVTEPVTRATGLDAAQLVKINGAVQVGAGAALALGILPRPAAAVLAISLVPTTLAGHRFWEHDDPTQRAGQRIHFLKNIAMLGGLVLAATSTGGRPSLPWRARQTVSHGIDSTREGIGALRRAVA